MNRIKELRALNNIKQIDLCSQLGVSQATLSGWENGKYEPDIRALNAMCDIFDVTTDYLLCRTGWNQCSICKNSYDPLNKYDSAEHDVFHEKYLKAVEKFGEIPLYTDASERRDSSIDIFRNPSSTLDEKLSAFDDYLKNSFIESIWKSHFDPNHDDFESFVKKELGKPETYEASNQVSNEFYETLLNKYNISGDNNTENSSSIIEPPSPVAQYHTLAAHFDGSDYTEDELREIENFAQYVKQRRSKD